MRYQNTSYSYRGTYLQAHTRINLQFPPHARRKFGDYYPQKNKREERSTLHIWKRRREKTKKEQSNVLRTEVFEKSYRDTSRLLLIEKRYLLDPFTYFYPEYPFWASLRYLLGGRLILLSWGKIMVQVGLDTTLSLSVWRVLYWCCVLIWQQWHLRVPALRLPPDTVISSFIHR
jgi:hypothetical protein